MIFRKIFDLISDFDYLHISYLILLSERPLQFYNICTSQITVKIYLRREKAHFSLDVLRILPKNLILAFVEVEHALENISRSSYWISTDTHGFGHKYHQNLFFRFSRKYTIKGRSETVRILSNRFIEFLKILELTHITER